MIHLTRINKLGLVVNADLIEQIETTPDTVVHLTSGQKLVVRESADEIIRKVVEYRQLIHGGCPMAATAAARFTAQSLVHPSPAAAPVESPSQPKGSE
jgi:flagellar protein FlbD